MCVWFCIFWLCVRGCVWLFASPAGNIPEELHDFILIYFFHLYLLNIIVLHSICSWNVIALVCVCVSYVWLIDYNHVWPYKYFSFSSVAFFYKKKYINISDLFSYLIWLSCYFVVCLLFLIVVGNFGSVAYTLIHAREGERQKKETIYSILSWNRF